MTGSKKAVKSDGRQFINNKFPRGYIAVKKRDAAGAEVSQAR
jgi:hypothetical protein